jgi:hypothetical protein
MPSLASGRLDGLSWCFGFGKSSPIGFQHSHDSSMVRWVRDAYCALNDKAEAI